MPLTQLADAQWPDFPVAGWEQTRSTLHRYSQVVGKVRAVLSAPVNHFWHVTLYVSARGLTTSPIPYGSGLFELEFDLVAHALTLRSSWGQDRSIPLAGSSVADFYARCMGMLKDAGVTVEIWTRPVEVANPVRFEKDVAPAAYDPLAANALWRVLIQVDRVFKQFRGGFRGKCSPVHFFWGGFDLAVTRFSGRRAPLWSGQTLNVQPHVMHESYSHEVSSAGFWPGNADGPPIFYSYAVPTPAGFSDAAVQPSGADFSAALGEFVLPYSVVQASDQPDEALLSFLHSTYAAAANLGHWDRPLLEDGPACDCVLDARGNVVSR